MLEYKNVYFTRDNKPDGSLYIIKQYENNADLYIVYESYNSDIHALLAIKGKLNAQSLLSILIDEGYDIYRMLYKFEKDAPMDDINEIINQVIAIEGKPRTVVQYNLNEVIQ